MKKILLLAMLIAAGCTTTSSHFLTGTPHSPIDWTQVKIYKETPPGAESIGIVNCSNTSVHNQRGMDSVVKKIKKDAASMGANGIVIVTQESNSLTGSSMTGTAIFVP